MHSMLLLQSEDRLVSYEHSPRHAAVWDDSLDDCGPLMVEMLLVTTLMLIRKCASEVLIVTAAMKMTTITVVKATLT